MEPHKISPSDMIHTVFEGLFQQISSELVAGTGRRHWSITSKRDQTSCHNSMSASKLAPCVSFGRDVNTNRRNHSSSNNAYEIPYICECPEHSQINMKYCHKLDAQPMGGLFTRLGTLSQDVARPNSSSLSSPPGTTAEAVPG